MSDKKKQLQQYIQASMIQSKKQHIQKQTQQLINYFLEDYKNQDPMVIMGERLKEKNKLYQSMKIQNDTLKHKTRNLQQELKNLKKSNGDGQFNANMRQSVGMDFFQRVNLGQSKFVNPVQDTDISSIKQQLDQINKEKQQIKQEDQQITKAFNQRLELFFTQLQRQHKVQLLKNYGTSIIKSQKQQMITIPKSIYDSLIKLYSIYITEGGLRQFQKSFLSNKNQQKLQSIEQEKENYINKYSDLMQHEAIQLKDLHQLFQILANRAGFDKQWERYHTQNQNKSIAFKQKIDKILRNNKISQNIQDQAQKIQKDNRKYLEFVKKLDSIVNSIQFNQKQIQNWKQIKNKIDQDNFLNIQKIIKSAKNQEQSFKSELTKIISELISFSLKESVKSFQNFMSQKLNKTIKKNDKLLDQISVNSIEKGLAQKFQMSNYEKWLQIAQKIIIKKSQMIKEYQKKHFVFMSTNEIYRIRANLK